MRDMVTIQFLTALNTQKKIRDEAEHCKRESLYYTNRTCSSRRISILTRSVTRFGKEESG